MFKVFCSYLFTFEVFSNELGELIIQTTKHGLLVSYTSRNVCLVTNRSNYGHNELLENLCSDHSSEGHHGH